LTVYLDASVLVGLLTEDALSEAAHAVAARISHLNLATSDLGQLEFTSAIARQKRMKTIAEDGARRNLRALDDFRSLADVFLITHADVASATGFISRLDLNLRPADAIHIALCRRLGLTLWTFDEGMAGSARALGVDLVES
jgi:predicted nucleic acid-binding protein